MLLNSIYRILKIIFLIFFKIFIKRRTIWHRKCLRNICHSYDFVDAFLDDFINIIPNEINPAYLQSPSDFARNRELPFPKLVTLVLSLTASGTSQGVDPKSGQFFKNARRSGLWPDANAVHRSSVCKARKKVPWQAFADILSEAVRVAYDLGPENDPKCLWHGMSVYATDGSKYVLPATDEIREEFDPDSGLQNKGKGHYPQCLVSTLYDVFRRLPVARTVVANDSSEREEIGKLLPFVPSNSVWLFDRGYPSYETIYHLKQNYDGRFLFRSPASCTFPAVEKFVEKGREESVVWIMPSNSFKSKISVRERLELKPIKLRVVRLESPDGTVSVLLTNLYSKKRFKRQDIIDLYFRRWEIESYYRDEKIILEIERFHSKNVNGILQEFYAAMIMSVISRTLMLLSSSLFFSGTREPQFKNAIITLASEASFLVPDDPEKALTIFNEVLEEMARVIYYRPKKPRSSQPRVNKRPLNKWNQNKKKLAANA